MESNTKSDYKVLRKDYHALKMRYWAEKHRVKMQARRDLETLKDEYTINRLTLKKPLKAKKYRLKVQKKIEHRRLNTPPERKVIEEIGNSITHGVGAIIAFVCFILMINKAATPVARFAAVVYGFCFICQMLFSCLYHAFANGTKVKAVFRRFDYSTIYLQIGGTFAPIYLVYMNDVMWGFPSGLIFFLVQWALIALGITFVAVFGPGRIRWLHYTLYFVLGWSGILFLPYFIKNDLPLLFFILGGGLFYTLGMIPFSVLKEKKTAHFIWHFFVLFGAIIQWLGIYLYVL